MGEQGVCLSVGVEVVTLRGDLCVEEGEGRLEELQEVTERWLDGDREDSRETND